jgi:hypothetical protein
MSALTLYDAARFALAEVRRVDEVKEIRIQAVALQEYARQANDTELLQHATEIRLRAERRAGELLADAPKHEGGRPEKTGSRPQPVSSPPPTLDELGVTKTQSSKWQKLAALPEDKFEIRVSHAKARVEGMTTSAPSYPKAEYTGENEWFTPAPWLQLARLALGEIDLDPASHILAQERVQASAFSPRLTMDLSGPGSGGFGLIRLIAARCSHPSLKSSSRNARAARSSRRFCLPTITLTPNGFTRRRARRGRFAFRAAESASSRHRATNAHRRKAKRFSPSAGMTKPSAARSPMSVLSSGLDHERASRPRRASVRAKPSLSLASQKGE